MSDKKAFVLDTNFIIKEKDLNEVIESLSDNFSVYVTQVSVEERIAQECRRIKTLFDEISVFGDKVANVAKITLLKSCEEEQRVFRVGMQKKYESTFQERLIPFSKDGAMLSAVLARAYEKKAPFLTEDKASDKGFKDALIWESILAYFKDNGENEVLLITDDNGFVKRATDLCSEFLEVTGKSLSILPNSYYRELLKPELAEKQEKQETFLIIPNIEALRERIQTTIADICYVQVEDDWGREASEETFFLSEPVDELFVKTMFFTLKETLHQNYLISSIPASTVLGLDKRVQDTGYSIPTAAIDNAVKLYEDMLEKYPDYIEQFYSVAARMINQNYRWQNETSSDLELDDDDGELPF